MFLGARSDPLPQATAADRGYHFRIAAGSAAELRAALQLAVTYDFVSEERVAPIDALLDRELAMLYRLEHAKR